MENKYISDNRIQSNYERVLKELTALKAENERLKSIVEAETIRADNWTKEAKQLQADKAELIEALNQVLFLAPWGGGDNFTDAKAKASKVLQKHQDK
jgi:regulator of replication initiation timing